MKEIALNEERALLNQLDANQATLLKESLISLIKMNS